MIMQSNSRTYLRGPAGLLAMAALLAPVASLVLEPRQSEPLQIAAATDEALPGEGRPTGPGPTDPGGTMG